jgi:hypothetical protein
MGAIVEAHGQNLGGLTGSQEADLGQRGHLLPLVELAKDRTLDGVNGFSLDQAVARLVILQISNYSQ